MEEKKSNGILLEMILYVLSIGLGIFSMSFAGIEVKSFLKYIGLGIGFWMILEIIILIGTIILNKKFNKNIDAEESQRKTILYFISNLVTLIVLTMSMEGSTKILGIIVAIFLFDFIPIVLTWAIADNPKVNSIIVSRTPSKQKYSVESHDIYDKFGNKIGSSTKYVDNVAGIEETYVKDKLGNTVAESTSMDGHTKTKINTTGRF